MTAPLLVPGSMLASRWIVGGLLGKSDGAEIYEAEATSERRFAALKLLDRELGVEPAWSEHVTLTRALSALPGDGLARAYDLGIEASLRRPYIASERITFPTVARYVAARGPLPLRVVAQALSTLASALDAAHAAGIVHGGLKPQNVFVSFDNPRWARITDFGLSRLRHRAGRGPESLLGFSAPEGTASPAADRYALALICFFGATGSAWYSALRSVDEASSERGRTRVASERAESQGAELDPLFDAWFARALHAEPSKRFGTAVEMASVFVDVFTGAPTAEMPARSSLPPPSVTPSAEPPQRTASSFPPGSPSGPPANAPSVHIETVSSIPPRTTSSVPPATVAPAVPGTGSSFPPRRVSSSPPLATAAVPRWFWFACAAMALVAVLAVWWLSRY